MHSKVKRDQITDSRVRIGIDLGESRPVLAITIQGDHGGEHMQFIGVLFDYEGCEQTNVTQLGSFRAKESYDKLANTIVLKLDDDIRRLSDSCAIVVGI